MADLEVGRIYLAKRIGYKNGKPLFKISDPCPAESGDYDAGTVVPWKRTGYKSSKPLGRIFSAKCEPDGSLTVGNIYPAKRIGYKNGKPLFRVVCAKCCNTTGCCGCSSGCHTAWPLGVIATLHLPFGDFTQAMSLTGDNTLGLCYENDSSPGCDGNRNIWLQYSGSTHTTTTLRTVTATDCEGADSIAMSNQLLDITATLTCYIDCVDGVVTNHYWEFAGSLAWVDGSNKVHGVTWLMGESTDNFVAAARRILELNCENLTGGTLWHADGTVVCDTDFSGDDPVQTGIDGDDGAFSFDIDY